MGRHYSVATEQFIAKGLSPQEAMQEAHRIRSLLRDKPYVPVSELPKEKADRRRAYNRRWMRKHRKAKRENSTPGWTLF